MNDTISARSRPSEIAPSLSSREVQARLVEVDEYGRDLGSRRYVVVESGGGAIAVVCIYVDTVQPRLGRRRTRWTVKDIDGQPGITVQVESLRRVIERRVLDTVLARVEWQVFEWRRVSASSSLAQTLQRRLTRGGHIRTQPSDVDVAGSESLLDYRFERVGLRAAMARIRARFSSFKTRA